MCGDLGVVREPSVMSPEKASLSQVENFQAEKI